MERNASTNLIPSLTKKLALFVERVQDCAPEVEDARPPDLPESAGEHLTSLTVRVSPVGATVILQTACGEPDEIDEATVPESGVVTLERPEPNTHYRLIVCADADYEHYDDCVEPEVSELEVQLKTFRCEVNFKTTPGAEIKFCSEAGKCEVYGPVDSSGELRIDSIGEGNWTYEISMPGHRAESGGLKHLRRGDVRPPIAVRLLSLPVVDFRIAPGARVQLRHDNGDEQKFGPAPADGELVVDQLSEGNWAYEIVLEHHETEKGSLEDLRAGTHQTVEVTLKPLPGWLKLRTGRWQIWDRNTRLGTTQEKIELAQGAYQLLLIDDGARPLILPVKIKSGSGRSYTESEAREFKPTDASRDLPWPNSLGMRFAPVPGTDVLFSIWPTRVRDYAAFAETSEDLDMNWQNPLYEGVAIKGGADHPVVCVNWEEARAFCRWLTARDRTAGLISAQQGYRLARDWEWSRAVGLKEAKQGSPESKDRRIPNLYPWGTEWPPREGAGNYADASVQEKFPGWGIIYGYRDGYVATSPVGSFDANPVGLYDLGGNCWEWVEDEYGDDSGSRVLRGASLYCASADDLLSSSRNCCAPDYRDNDFGFRVVLVGAAER